MTASVIILAVVLSAFSPNAGDAAHNGLTKTPCTDCHTRLPLSGGAPSLRGEVSDGCLTCHPLHHGTVTMKSHPVNTVPSMRVPVDMLLDRQRRIVCITCHAFHGEYRDEDGNKSFYLRRTPGKTFCYSCHKKL